MKTIYQPKGKAGEYAKYAVNFYNGCGNGCTYCFNKRGVLKHTLGGDSPVLQKRYNNEHHAMTMFCEDIRKHKDELYDDGLFFTFSSDPCLEKTWKLNADAIIFALQFNVPCTILTKCAGMAVQMVDYIEQYAYSKAKELLAVGFTLTGHDRLEPNASTNYYRTQAMRKLHERGYKVWASIEPIIDIASSLDAIIATVSYCDHYKIGLQSGVKKDYYKDEELREFVETLREEVVIYKTPIYLKDSILERLNIKREWLAFPFVGADYSIFRPNK